MARITEDHLEQQCLAWFQDLGYTHVFAPQLAPDGTIAIPDGPGLGMKWNPDAIAKFTGGLKLSDSTL